MEPKPGIGPLWPPYAQPRFDRPPLSAAPAARFEPAPRDGVLPDGFHATSNHPEYVHLEDGRWLLVRESRMDAVLRRVRDGIEATEPRHVRAGDAILVGRSDDGSEGIFVHPDGFSAGLRGSAGKFGFRTRGTRETPFSRCYDDLYRVLRHDREHGRIVWVLGPAVAFDRDSRQAMQGLVADGFVHALLAGNALAVHDLEATLFGTGLGQDIYTRELRPGGHYHHLDVINRVGRHGSLADAIEREGVHEGILYACRRYGVPTVLAGSIRDDGPLPGVLTDVLQAQEAMRHHARRATTVIALATQLHAIAFGNMLPGYRVEDDGSVRPVFLYIVDMSEFAVDKLANRGSAQATAILTNVQDFVVNLWHNLSPRGHQHAADH